MDRSFPSRIEHIESDGFAYVYDQERCNQIRLEGKFIYVLLSHDFLQYQKIQVVYVGKTRDPKNRLAHPHPAERRYGSSLSCYAMQCDDIDTMEIDFIKRYKPLLNNQHNG